MFKIIKYNHHGKDVFVREDLKGTHRDKCLCWECDKFKLLDRENSCQRANELYAFCVKYWMVTPVFECPEFVQK